MAWEWADTGRLLCDARAERQHAWLLDHLAKQRNGGAELALIPGRLPAVSSLAATGVGLTRRSPKGWVLALDDLPPPAWVRQLLMVEAGR